jgi:sugar lactone lactonase YvrE
MLAPMSRLLCAVTDKVSALLIAFAEAGSRPRLQFARYVTPALPLLLGPALVWGGALPTSFKGVATALSTGSVSLAYPNAAAVDAQGNVYIADGYTNQVVEVSATGTASVVSFPGLSPALANPCAVAVDGSGNLYVGEENAGSGSGRVIELSGGVASVVPTAGLVKSASGLAVDATGDIYIVDNFYNQIVEVPAGGTAAVRTITGLSPPLAVPNGLAVDSSGNLFVTDAIFTRIVKVTPGGAGSVFATGGLTLNQPNGVAIDQLGNVYIADSLNNRVVSVAPGGSATVLNLGNITLVEPLDVVVGASGDLYIADTGNNRVVEVQNAAVGFGHLPLGATTGTTLTLPFSIGYANTIGNVQAYTVGAASLDFTIVPGNACPNVAGNISCGGGTTCVAGVTNTTCNVVVQFLPTAAGLRRGAVVLYDNSNPAKAILTVPIYATADAPMAALSPGTASLISTGSVATTTPYQIALDGAGDVYVANYIGSNVVKVAAGGGTATVVSTGAFSLDYVVGVAVDGSGNLFIADYYDSRIVVVTAGGVASVLSITGLSPGLNLPCDLAFDAAGNLYIADHGTNKRIVKVSSLVVTGATSTGAGAVFSTGTYTFTHLDSVIGVAADAAGTVYIADAKANNIVKVTAAGAASVLPLPGITPGLNFPDDVAVDSMDNVYIADNGNNRIVEVTANGVASVVPTPGLTLNGPGGVAVDSSGNIVVADASNNRLVRLNIAAASLAFPNTYMGSASAAQTATVTNLGNQPLLFAANPTYTANFSQPTGSEDQCLLSTSLAAGAVCDISVEFTPQSAGSLSANIVVTNNALNVSGSTQSVSVSGTGLASGDSTALSVSTSPTAATIGQQVTVTAIVGDTAAGHTATVPTGGVTFIDTAGSTSVSLNGGNAVALSGGTAVLTGVTLNGAGLHTITANYGGVTGSFATSSNTTTLTVSKNTEVITGPSTQPVQVVINQTGSVPITVTAPYAGIAMPSGSLSYTVLNSSNASVATGAATLTAGETSSTATVPVANSLAAGAYTVSVSYGGDSNYTASSVATTVQLSIGQITPTVNWAQPAGITYGTTLNGLLAASAAYGETSVPGSFSYSATLQGGSAVAVTSATVLDGGSYTLTATFTPTDTTTYKTATGVVSLTVAKAGTAVALATSAATVLLKSTVTFTVTVSSTAGVPTGSAGFYDGTTLLGSGTLAQGVATYTTSTLASGAHTITAQYVGSGNFAALTSSAVSETVQDFSLNVAASGTTFATVTPGGTATYDLVIGPKTGTTFPATITLSVIGFPSGATATLTPTSLASGAGSTNVTLTVQVPSQTAWLRHNSFLASELSPLMLGMLFLPFAGHIRRSGGKRNLFALMLLLALVGATLVGLSGCGSKPSGFLGNSQTSYTLTVTGTSGALTHSTTLNLTVQ